MKAIFFNEFGRVRSGWRFLISLLAMLFLTTLFGATILVALMNSSFGFNQQSLMFLTLGNAFTFVIALFVGWLCNKFFEGLPFRALGASFSDLWFKHLVLGLIFGVAAILLAGLIAMIAGGLRFEINAFAGNSAIWVTVLTSLLIFIVGAASEEAIFRGYILQTFARAHLAWFAIILTAVFFAAGHLQNPNASAISTANTGIAGVLFGIAYLKTRTLWFPFGLHLTWNWIQGAFLGIPVSGLKELTTAPLLLSVDSGPTWLTGGEYGIEGGIACTVALVLTAVVIWFAPFLKPTEEMLALTDQEKPASSGEIFVNQNQIR